MNHFNLINFPGIKYNNNKPCSFEHHYTYLCAFTRQTRFKVQTNIYIYMEDNNDT